MPVVHTVLDTITTQPTVHRKLVRNNNNIFILQDHHRFPFHPRVTAVQQYSSTVVQ